MYVVEKTYPAFATGKTADDAADALANWWRDGPKTVNRSAAPSGTLMAAMESGMEEIWGKKSSKQNSRHPRPYLSLATASGTCEKG